jgi:hypothetical protein
MLFALFDKLIDRIVQLATYRKGLRRALLDEQVEPVFATFEAIHKHYLESFAQYRDLLRTSSEPLGTKHRIFERIRTDNLFSDHERARIMQLGEATDDPQLGPLVGAIRDYIVDMRIAQDPIDGYRKGKFRNTQLWRRTLLTELEAISQDRLQIVLDPASSAPPLNDDNLERALAALRKTAGIAEEDTRKGERLKVHLAVAALDEIVGEMQDAYARVASEYATLRAKLARP